MNLSHTCNMIRMTVEFDIFFSFNEYHRKIKPETFQFNMECVHAKD